MDTQQELKVMQSFYDRIFQMVTYTPTDMSPVQERGNTLINLVRNRPIDLASYTNMVSPGGAGTQDLRASEKFFTLADAVGAIGVDFVPQAGGLESTYGPIVGGADTTETVTKEQKSLYDKAQKFLYEMKTGFDGKPYQAGPSSVFAAYQKNQSAYAGAVAAYQLAYTKYDLSKPDQQRQWMAESGLLNNAITQAWNNWEAAGKAAVDEALDALQSSDNNFVAEVIKTAQDQLRNEANQPLVPGGNQWYTTYAQPSNWWDPNATDLWTDFTLSSNYLYTDTESYLEKQAASGGFSFLGLIHWGGQGAHSSKTDSYHLEGDNLTISAKIMTVSIQRPWFSDLLFRSAGWSLTGQPVDAISDGTVESSNTTKMMPIVPTQLVLMKDVSITADWTTKDTQTIQTAQSGGGGFGFGPFSASGGSGTSHSGSTVTSSFSGGTLSFTGVQNVAVVNAVTPPSAPVKG